MKSSAQTDRITEGGGETLTPKVCLLTETYYPVVGGGETHARLLAGQLAADGIETQVITRRTNRSFPQKEKVFGIDTYRLPPSGMKRFGKYAMLPYVFHELKQRRDEYDIILVCGFRILGIPAVLAARQLGKVCVLRAECHGEMSGGYASAYRKLPQPIDAGFKGWIAARNRILRNADAFISISTPITEEYESSGVNSERIYQIPNGVDTQIFRPVIEAERLSLRAKLGLPMDKMLVMYSGKLNQGKGLEHLLLAWDNIMLRRRDLHLLLVGAGGGQSLSKEDELRRFVEDRGLDDSVTFTGYVHNTQEYVQASDIFVLPSENEGLPMCILEAMSCRLAVIGTHVGGIPDVIRDEDNGLLIEPRNPRGIERAITDIADNPAFADSLAENGRQTVLSRYSIGPVTARYKGLFTSLCSRRRG